MARGTVDESSQDLSEDLDETTHAVTSGGSCHPNHEARVSPRESCRDLV